MKQDFIELFDLTSGQATSKGWFKREDIYHIEPPTAEDQWVSVDLRLHVANLNMFYFMVFLAVLIIGIPWCIAYFMSVSVKTTRLVMPRAQYDHCFTSGTNYNWFSL